MILSAFIWKLSMSFFLPDFSSSARRIICTSAKSELWKFHVLHKTIFWYFFRRKFFFFSFFKHGCSSLLKIINMENCKFVDNKVIYPVVPHFVVNDNSQTFGSMKAKCLQHLFLITGIQVSLFSKKLFITEEMYRRRKKNHFNRFGIYIFCFSWPASK